MAYNSKILEDVLRARALTTTSLSRRLGMETETLRRELRREPEPKQAILRAIAKDLALPPFVFYMERAPRLPDLLPDFRADPTVPTPKARETMEAIQLAEGIQRAVSKHKARPARQLPSLADVPNDEIEAFALRARKFFEITLEDQKKARDTKAFYNVCRRKIEDKGIFVVQDGFPAQDGSGFCLYDSKYPIIIINTRQQSRGRRLFTLIHELGHLLMHRSGISDPFETANRVERRCNQFAVSFLVPREYVSELLGRPVPSESPTNDQVRWAANRLKISQEATVLRLQEMGQYVEGSYDSWKQQFHNSGDNPDFSDKGGGAGGPPPQEKVKLAKYGFRVASAFDELMQEGRTNEIDVYRATGIKPKYLRAYVDFAKDLTAIELRDLELDDG